MKGWCNGPKSEKSGILDKTHFKAKRWQRQAKESKGKGGTDMRLGQSTTGLQQYQAAVAKAKALSISKRMRCNVL